MATSPSSSRTEGTASTSALIPGTLVDCEEVRASLNAKLEVALYSGAAQNSYGGGLRTTCEQYGVHGYILVVPGTLSDCQAVRDQLNGLVDGTLFGCNDDYMGEGDSTPNTNSGIKFLGTCVDPTLAVAVDAMNCLTGAKTDCDSYVYEFFVGPSSPRRRKSRTFSQRSRNRWKTPTWH